MAPHAFAKGEWIGSIAASAGFPAWQVIWQDDGNSRLRNRREPNLLLENDEIWIPSAKDFKKVKETKLAVRVRTRKKNDLVWYDKDKLRVRVVRVKEYLRLFGPIPFALTAGKESLKGKITKDAQVLEIPLALAVRTATLDLGGRVITLEIGGLGPLETVAGVQGRLNNLGWDAGEVNDLDGPPTRSAVRDFQAFRGIQVDGAIAGATRSEAKTAYGC